LFTPRARAAPPRPRAAAARAAGRRRAWPPPERGLAGAARRQASGCEAARARPARPTANRARDTLSTSLRTRCGPSGRPREARPRETGCEHAPPGRSAGAGRARVGRGDAPGAGSAGARMVPTKRLGENLRPVGAGEAAAGVRARAASATSAWEGWTRTKGTRLCGSASTCTRFAGGSSRYTSFSMILGTSFTTTLSRSTSTGTSRNTTFSTWTGTSDTMSFCEGGASRYSTRSTSTCVSINCEKDTFDDNDQ